jgi:hypothetical protein
MTVETDLSRAAFYGSGSTGPFTFNFRFLKNSQIVVVKTDVDGVSTTLLEDDDYTITGVGTSDGGSVTLLVALAIGESLVVRRVLSLLQQTSITNQGAFYPEIHETVFDRLVMMIQQVNQLAEEAFPMVRPTMTELGLFFGTASEIAAIDIINKYATESDWIAAGRQPGTYWLFFEIGSSVAIPDPPVAVAVGGSGEITLSWATVSGATSYNVYWSATPGSGSGGGATKVTGATSPLVQSGLADDTTRYYVVTAVNAGGESEISDEVSGVTTSTSVLFQDLFNNSSIDSTNFTSILGGSGTLVENTTGLTIDSPSLSDSAAIVYKTQMPLANRKYTIRSSINANWLGFTTIKGATLTASLTNAQLTSQRRLISGGGLTGVALGYVNTLDAVVWLFNTSGSETYTEGEMLDFILETTPTQFRWSYGPVDFVSATAISAWTNWTSVKGNPSTDGINHWLSVGDVTNDVGSGDIKITLLKIEDF